MPHYHRADRDEIIAHLAQRFPKCFFVDPPQRRPLKHTVIDDLEREDVLDREKLAQAGDWYCSHFSYEYALVAGNERVDLDGKKAGTVTPLEQREALKRITARKQELRERERDTAPAVRVTTTKLNGAVMAKATHPTLHPLLSKMQSAIAITNNILVEPQYEPLRPELAKAALTEIVGYAEALSQLVSAIQPKND
jgi:sRNA-binding protein